MGSRRPEPASNSTREMLPWQMLQEILLKLPTKDVGRSCCVSRLWRSVVSDDSFRNLHAVAMASQVTAARTAEALLVSVSREPGRSDKARVFNMSSGKAMSCFPVPARYGLANICNGLLCFVYDGQGPEAPAIVCNPITGETVSLPRAPPLERHICSYLFALGFSLSTKEYKLFRLSYPSSISTSPEHRRVVVVDVCTLGDARRWRRHSFISPSFPAKVSTPVSIDGKIYLLALSWAHLSVLENPKTLLAIDVATESCYTYHLPDYDTFPYDLPTVGTFELNGLLWFAAPIIDFADSMTTMDFWVMSPPSLSEDSNLEGDHQLPSWDLNYSFLMETNYDDLVRPWACWLEGGDQILCYLRNNTLYKYDMRLISNDDDGLLQWDKELPIPSCSECRWNVYGGYRPTLLSPCTFALPPPPQNDDQDKHQCELTLLSALRSHD